MFPIIMVVTLLLRLSAVQLQSTTRHCDDDDSAPCDCRHNQADIARLQQEVAALTEELTKNADRFSLGTTTQNAARSCKHILDRTTALGLQPANRAYWICTSADCTVVEELFCDMRSGGWTLVGQIGGAVGNVYDKWLIRNENPAILRTPMIEADVYGCVDATKMAVDYSREVRLSSGESEIGMGRFWIEWDLPSDRDVDTFWRLAVGYNAIRSAEVKQVDVRSSFASRRTCYQNRYGIMNYKEHGGSYPSAAYNTNGNTATDDTCMAVGVMSSGQAFGFSQNNNGYDSSTSNTDWPNGKYNHKSPFVAVWLR